MRLKRHKLKPDELLSTSEAARLAGVPPLTIFWWAVKSRRLLPSRMVWRGNRQVRLIQVKDLAAYEVPPVGCPEGTKRAKKKAGK